VSQPREPESAIGASDLLVRREPGQFVACRSGRLITVAEFLSQANGLAQSLSDTGPVINLCEHRYHFMLGFAAALARGLATLLPPNPLPETINVIHRKWPGSQVLCDWPVALADAPIVALDLSRTGPPDNVVVAASTLAAVAFTSGSTGEPEPQPKSWQALVDGTAINLGQYLAEATDTYSIVATVPPQHMWGFESTVLCALRGPVIAHDGRPFYPVDVRDALLEVPAPRVLVSTPVHLRALIRSGMDFPPVVRVLSATAPMDAALAAAVESAFGAELVEICGCTEVGSMASRRTALGHSWRLFAGLEARVDGTTTFISAPHLPTPVPLADQLEFAPDGGFLLVGRTEDLVKIGGKRGSLAEVTRQMLAVPGVEDAAVFSPLDGTVETRLVAFVVTRTLEPASVRETLLRVMDPVFIPRPILRVPSLPRSATGKLTRAALLDLYRRSCGEAPAGP
jgi:acyl-coenzyme A synthetase/AMP-(fatty) acid ligase